jgi:hypothetical protein
VRLDHLLSKEHTPIARCHCGGGVDGVSLVESSTNGPAAWGSCLSTAPVALRSLSSGCGGVEPGAVTWEVRVFGTLLGPEESGAGRMDVRCRADGSLVS